MTDQEFSARLRQLERERDDALAMAKRTEDDFYIALKRLNTIVMEVDSKGIELDALKILRGESV